WFRLLFWGMLVCFPVWGQYVQPIDMVILLDRSGSMINTDPDGITAPAAAFIVEQLMLANPENRVAVVPFASQAYILGRKGTLNPGSALTSSFPAVVGMLQAGNSQGAFTFRELAPDDPQKFLDLLRTQMREEGETELELALQLAGGIFSGSDDNRRKIIVLISDGEPYPVIRRELERRFGHNLVQQAARERAAGREKGPNNRRLVRMYQEYILNKVAPAIRSAGIELYPIAFVGEGQAQAPLIEYLKTLKQRITGDDNVIIANRQNLIAQLIDFVPSNFNHIRVAKIEPFMPEGQASKDWDITIPNIGKQIRFFLFYPEARPNQRVGVKIYRDGQLVGEDINPERFTPLVYHQFLDRGGRLVFQSFQLIGRDNAAGQFRLVLSPAGTRTMPAANLLVDLNTSIYPEIAFTPTPPIAQEDCDGLLQLRDLETDRTFSIEHLNLVSQGIYPE
ncbi:MAG: VWA domain-containing protein, partial [Calditrichaeota bacterium]